MLNAVALRLLRRWGYAWTCAALLAAAGCAKDDHPRESAVAPPPDQWWQATSNRQIPDVQLTSDYFPSAPGTTWEYEVQIGPTPPLLYSEQVWADGGRNIVYPLKTTVHAEQASGSQTPRVSLSVRGAASHPAFPGSNGVAVDVVKDDAFLFPIGARPESGTHSYGKMFWLRVSEGFPQKFLILQVTTVAPDEIPNKDFLVPGYASRAIFFGRPQGTVIGVGQDPNDRNLFDGTYIESTLNQKLECRHYVRTVTELERGVRKELMKEDSWFCLNTGLVRLQQSVNGEVSMTWTLVNFTRGTGPSLLFPTQ